MLLFSHEGSHTAHYFYFFLMFYQRYDPIYIYIYIHIYVYIMLLNFFKLITLLIKKGSHKRYATPRTLAVVWALWFFKIFLWSELNWWALKEQNSCCLQIDRILCSLTLLTSALYWPRRVATSDIQRSQI